MHVRRMRQIAASLLLAAALLAPAPGQPGATEAPLTADYAVRWSGLEIGRFSTELRRTGERYHLAYQAWTSGPLRWVVDLQSDGWAAGRLIDGAVRAEHFRGQSSWRDGAGHWRVTFAADGSVTEIELDAATTADREPVPEALRRGPDPLSLMLLAMQAARAGEVLEGQSFDGRRAMRYSLACAAEKSPIRPVALGAASRDALVCAADGALVAGRSKRWSDRAEARRPDREPARIWLVPGVGGMPHWPVRIEAESRWGRVTIELDTFTDPAA
jgi:hypothetical protein